MIAHDRRTEEADANESVVVMHNGAYYKTPCQLLKLPLTAQKQEKTIANGEVKMIDESRCV